MIHNPDNPHDNDSDMLDDDSKSELLDDENIDFNDELANASSAADSLAPESVSLSDIPLKIHLEVARFKTTLGELQNMQPGYKLPLTINPWIVQLTLEGKTIGKGELVEIGDVIGVKILEIYR